MIYVHTYIHTYIHGSGWLIAIVTDTIPGLILMYTNNFFVTYVPSQCGSLPFHTAVPFTVNTHVLVTLPTTL